MFFYRVYWGWSSRSSWLLLSLGDKPQVSSVSSKRLVVPINCQFNVSEVCKVEGRKQRKSTRGKGMQGTVEQPASYLVKCSNIVNALPPLPSFPSIIIFAFHSQCAPSPILVGA